MAETIEMITWPKHKKIYYQVTSSAFTFEVKGSGDAVIGLASSLKKECEFLIKIDYNSYISIMSNNNQGVNRQRQSTPNLISNTQYRRFWITWYGGWLAFGRHGETTPIILLAEASTNNIKYITFGTYNNVNNLHWRFDLPPLFKQPALKPLTDGKLRWVQADSQLPDDALIGGYENEFLYIIRAAHRGSLTPGKFVPSLGLGFIPWGGSSNEKTEFEVLCGCDCSWVPSNTDKISVDAIEVGYSEDRFERLYLGRAKYMGHLIPGKVQLSHKVCYIAFGEREIAVADYDVLVRPNTNPYSTNRVFASSFEQMTHPLVVNQRYADDDDDDDEDGEEHDDNYYNIDMDEGDYE